MSQHLKTDKHLKGVNRCKAQPQRKQQLMTVNISEKSLFNKDLCEALISSNIPLNKLSNPKFKNFLEIYTKNEIPCEATLHGRFVDDIYTETINAIRENIFDKKICVNIYETTNAEDRFIANVIVGILKEYCAGDIFLLNSDELDKANHFII